MQPESDFFVHGTPQSVDISDLATARGVMMLLRAFRSDGAVLLRGALEAATALGALDDAIRLFGISEADKVACAASGVLKPGYRSYGTAKALDTGIPNSLESWGFSRHDPHCLPPGFSNTWFRLARYGCDLTRAAEAVLIALDRAYDTPGEIARHIRQPLDVELMHYPRRLVGRAPGARRQSVHRDSSLITLLPPATGPGLLAEFATEMTPVSPRADEVLVIVGSALEYLTAGDLTACLHTVGTPNATEVKDRTSIILFVPPAPESTLEPLSSLRDQPNYCEFPPVSAEEHQGAYTGSIFGSTR